MKNQKVILIVTGGIIVVFVLAGAFFIRDMYFGAGNQTQEINSGLNTVFLEQKDLKTYENFEGTLKYEDDVRIITEREGVLTYLAPEGQELSRGAEIYRIYRSTEASEILAADQQVTSAQANVAQAELALENLNAPATAAQIASADASIAQAELALENLNAPATAAQIASADASVAQAELALENLNAPATAAQIASADASIAQAELALENLNAPATAAQIASADASVSQAEANLAQGKNTITSTGAGRLIARQSLCTADKEDEASWLCPDNLRGEPFRANLIASLIDMISNNILSVEANNLLNAQKNYEAALESQRTFEKNLEQALNSRSALDDPPTEAELLQATRSLQSSKEQRLALDETPTEAELLQATRSLQSSKEQRLALGEAPTEAELLQATRSLNSATSSLNTALQKRKNLVEGYSASLLMFGDIPAWRDMKEGIVPGEDINQLKLNLIALGYGTIETLGPDWNFNKNTSAAIMKFQADLNIISSGEIVLGEIIFAPGTSLVKSSSTLQTVGGKMNAGMELFFLTPVEKVSTQIGSDGAINLSSESLQIVEIQVDVADRNLTNEGSKVEIELPDESIVIGTVRQVGNLAVVPQEGDPFLEVLIVVEGSTEYFEWTGAAVTINVTKELAKGVLASPVTGLLALLSGGYALEVVTATGTILVPVETGIYADGWVEINGSGLQPGTEIVVPN